MSSEADTLRGADRANALPCCGHEVPAGSHEVPAGGYEVCRLD